MEKLIKGKLIFWLLFLYCVIFLLFYVFVLIPQKNLMLKNKTEKEILEYNYLKIKSSPKFLNTLLNNVSMVEDKIKKFEWLIYEDDPNLALYQYLEDVSKNTGIEIIYLSGEEKRKTEEKSKEKETPYYFWNLKLMGDFSQFLSFVYNIETGEKYLKIEEIELIKGEKEKNFYNIKIAGIKEVK
jgi:Tfp pilus assembly protein PilO